MRLVLDFETTSIADLKRTGTHAYAEHPETRVTVLCYAIDDEPVETWIAGQGIPDRFVQAVRNGAVVVAHNYLFEWNIYYEKLVPRGWPVVPLSQWSCTMARALVAGWPASLELIGEAMKLTQQKDPTARDLMLRFARPRSLSPLTWWHETDPVRFQRLCDYCAQDVKTERELDRKLPELSARERTIFEIDHQINQRGIGIDHRLVNDLTVIANHARNQLTGEITRLTNGQVKSLNQVAVLRQWLDFQGADMPDLRRATVQAKLHDKTLTEPARKALRARLDASRASTAKLTAIASARSADGRVRGAFQYYGASRTGRWAGRRLQPQNLFRGSISDVPAAVRAIRAGASPEELDMLFEDSPLGVIASCMRSTIMAGPLHRLCVADLSQIEARVLAWLAGQADMLDVFRRGQDIYSETAKAIGSPNRQLGKVLVLACGFGMGWERFRQTALSYGLVLDEDEASEAVMAWRRLNHRVVNFWWESHRCLMRVVRHGPGATERFGAVVFIHRPGMVLLRLPSGRHLVYRHPRIEKNAKDYDEFVYRGSLGGNWVWIRSWPGKIVENITQAVARDVLVESMLYLGDLLPPLIATIHDELIAEVPEDEAENILDLMLKVMRKTPSWAPGLPVDAAGFIVRRYTKG